MCDLSHAAWVNSRRCYTPRELTHASLFVSKVKCPIKNITFKTYFINGVSKTAKLIEQIRGMQPAGKADNW